MAAPRRSERTKRAKIDAAKAVATAAAAAADLAMTASGAASAMQHTPLQTTCACSDTRCMLSYTVAGQPSCVHEPSDASASSWVNCLDDANSSGIYIISRSSGGQPVCSAGDSWRASLEAHTWLESDRPAVFSSISRPLGRNLYYLPFPAVRQTLSFANHDVSASLQESFVRGGKVVQDFGLSIFLVETWRRSRSRDMSEASAMLSLDDLTTWLRFSKCEWQPLLKNVEVRLRLHETSPHAKVQQCNRLPDDSLAMGYVSLGASPSTCDDGKVCWGDGQARLVNTSSRTRLTQRKDKTFDHVLKPVGCVLRLYDEHEFSRCLSGRRVLNAGSPIAVNLHRGFGLLNSTIQSWTHRRAESRTLPFGQRLPHAGDFVYQFERTGNFNGRGPDVPVGVATFGRGSVETLFLHHPAHYGLANIFEIEMAKKAGGRVGFQKTQQYERFFCRHEIVIFESGVSDFSLPLSTAAMNRVRSACSGSTLEACKSALALAIKGEEWRLRPLTAYKQRLRSLLDIWRRCRKAKPVFRAIFKLAPAPRAMQGTAGCMSASGGLSAFAHHLEAANRVAKQMVEDAGFETFNGFATTLHAPATWFDEQLVGGASYTNHGLFGSQTISDVETQAIINQICSKSHSRVSGV